MKTRKTMSAEERKSLINDLYSLKIDGDDALIDSKKGFLPLAAHKHALLPEKLIVRGGRGAGKSALFRVLSEVEPETRWVEGMSSQPLHPSHTSLSEFATTADDSTRRAFWLGWLCARLHTETRVALPAGLVLETGAAPGAIAAVASSNLHALSTWLDALEQQQSKRLIVTYDALDRLGASIDASKAMTTSLLALWLSLADRYRNIRPKIFVREDLFQASLSAFPDASKLDARSISLQWTVEDLYRVLVKHMANTSEGLRAWLQGSTKGVTLTSDPTWGWMPPGSMPEEGKDSQKNFVSHLAGEKMGAADHKGMTHRWIPNRLQDARGQAVPRSILSIIRHAADYALTGKSKPAPRLMLLTPQQLYAGLPKTSLRRVEELKEEVKVVGRLQSLRGKTVPLPRKQALAALAVPSGEDGFGSDGEGALAALIEHGVISERKDGRIDVADIYRYGFDIKRKGGVKRPT
jgi:hypothetical protein